MKLVITGRQIDTGESFRGYVEERLATINEKYGLSPVDAALTLSREAHLFKSDISLKLGRMPIRVQGMGDEIYPSVDSALGTLEGRIRRYKRRLQDHHKHHDVHFPEESAPYYVLNGKDHSTEPQEDLAPAIIAETSRNILTLSVEDAVMRLDLSDEPTYVFRNSKHGRINILYRRSDGNIGWVDPE